jgi:hypothetical protein
VVVILVLSVGCFVFAVLWGVTEQRCKRAVSIADDLGGVRNTNLALHDSVRILRREIAGAHQYAKFWYERTASARQNQGMLLDECAISNLMQMGIKDPVNDLRRDLLAHRELIPYEGVLGGTMAFIEESISLLSTRWVFAEFEDGHIQGRCLLSYEVGPGAHISWKVLSATLD